MRRWLAAAVAPTGLPSAAESTRLVPRALSVRLLRRYPLPVAVERRQWHAAREVEMRTYSPKASEIQRAWHVIDAEGLVLGRLCTEVARILRGKHKPIFAPHIDTGDHVIIVNADKVVLTSGKADAEGRATATPATRAASSTESYADLLARKPDEAVRRSVRGMLPKGPLGRQMLKKLKVYAGPDASARRPAAAAARARRTPRPAERREDDARCPSRSSRPPVVARRPSPASACAPAPA